MNIRVLLSILLLFLSFSVQATFQEASKLYKEKKYEQAFIEFQQLAKIGHKPSQFNVGVMYLEGVGVEQDLVKAYAWVKLSEEENTETALLEEIKSYFPEQAMLELSEKVYNNLYSKYNSDVINRLYSPEITGNVHELSSPKLIYSPEPEFSFRKTGWVVIAFHLSSSGYPIDIRIVESFPDNVFDRQSKAVFKNWKFQTGEGFKVGRVFKYKLNYVTLLGGESYHVTKYRELDEIKTKAIGGDPTSQFLHARYGWYNHDQETAFNSTPWYHEAAKRGVLNAQYEVAEKLINGDGCKKNPQKAIRWLTLSASNDFAESQFKLATLALNKGNYDEGLEWLNRALRSNIENPAFDSEVLSYNMIHYIYKNQIKGIKPEAIIQQLQKVENATVSNPVFFYQYYASAYQELGNYQEALKYQRKAVDTLKEVGEASIPQKMLDVLTYLESKTG